MRKILPIVVAVFVMLIGCSGAIENEAADNPSEESQATPEVIQESVDVPKPESVDVPQPESIDVPKPESTDAPEPEVTDAPQKDWPTEWKEVLDGGKHTCTIDATVEMDAGPREAYLVYEKTLSEEYLQKVKDLFLQAGNDPRGAKAPKDALVESLKTNYLLLMWGGPKPVQQPERYVLDGDTTPDEAGHALNNVSISQAEAQEKADAFLESIDLGEELALFHAEKARIIDGPSHATLCEGWCFTYSSKVPGCIPVFLEDKHLHGQMDIPYSRAPFEMMSIEIMVTEDGVMEFCYYNPIRVELEGSVEDELLDFESVQRYFRKCFTQGLQSMTFDETVFDPHVQRIVLSYALRPAQNAAGALRPAWVALFTTEDDESMPSKPLNYVCIDAVTGEVLEPFL